MFFPTYTWRLGCGIYWFAFDLSGFSLAWIVHDGRMGWTEDWATVPLRVCVFGWMLTRERERESTALTCAATCGSNLSARGNCRRRRGRAFGVIFLDHLSLYYLPLLARPSCHPQSHTFPFFPWCEILTLDWRVCRLPFSYMLCIPVWRFNL
jgi:hypothetical protein